MNLEEYRIECTWSKNEMARQAGIDTNTLGRAINGDSISITTAGKLAAAISKKLGRTVRFRDIEGLNVNV
jgi:DNA-binding XRE family transcriptional regulator